MCFWGFLLILHTGGVTDEVQDGMRGFDLLRREALAAGGEPGERASRGHS